MNRQEKKAILLSISYIRSMAEDIIDECMSLEQDIEQFFANRRKPPKPKQKEPRS